MCPPRHSKTSDTAQRSRSHPRRPAALPLASGPRHVIQLQSSDPGIARHPPPTTGLQPGAGTHCPTLTPTPRPVVNGCGKLLICLLKFNLKFSPRYRFNLQIIYGC